MIKHQVLLVIGLAILLGGCVVDDEPLTEDPSSEDSDMAYSLGRCTIYWYAPGYWQRVVGADSWAQCDQQAGEVGHQHCEELRAGASGPNPLRIEFVWERWDAPSSSFGYKNYWCEGVRTR